MKIKNPMMNKKFKQKLDEGYNYPTYPNLKNGDRLLLDIRNYLIKRKEGKRKELYPNYIINDLNNVETAKRYFRNLANKYQIDENNKLYLKKNKDKSLLAVDNIYCDNSNNKKLMKKIIY